MAWSRNLELARIERSHTSPSLRLKPFRAFAPYGESNVATTLGGTSVPRHTHSKQSSRRSTPTTEKGGGRSRRPPARETDAQALALRESGKSFSAIARSLGLERATEAHRSFVRAIGTHEGAERRQIIEREETRLDELEQRIRTRDASDTEKLERRLLGVKKLRAAMEL